MHSVPREACTLPHQASRLGQQLWHLSAHELVACGLLAVRVDLALVRHVPRPACGAVVVCGRLLGVAELRLLCVERVAVLVLCASDLAVAARCVDHEHGVVGAVDVRVDAQTE
jgi:hypothetical protein